MTMSIDLDLIRQSSDASDLDDEVTYLDSVFLKICWFGVSPVSYGG